ncbi:helix-turn-helix protein [Aneurinibacillus soli]|uniref:Transcriptional repressor DicA n=1 Tax=Aneurinibacillus soli TaxID=1500254 RepID=A0A0U5C6G3_9BACL|nr:helix-turn-helix domain-containing protein [Aneurinibacillus soli]PYE63417.1 helix-turn-helix protein [Aneurinibacillus soli]BAU27651.1 transcriptional repressor DicA [Aneurinibacillus soli]
MFIVELAKQAKLTKEMISMIERGVYTPKIKTLKKLSEALDIPIWYLGCFENLPEDTLGQRLRKAKLYAGLISSELAQILSASHRSVCSWERDEAIPSPENKLAVDEFIRTQLSD